MAMDPSQNVHGDLLPHVHLLSTFRYASMPRVELSEVTKWLLQAPKIARDTAPFYWTYLDCPADGTIFLTWQPTVRRGTEFASDGYVWAGPEVFFQHGAGNGLVLEIYYQKTGYRMGEQFAIHSRRRFRLLPSQAPVQNSPQVDPNLWIVHYGPAEKNDRLPVAAIGIPPPMQPILSFRQHLFQMGQIVRKEFMLSDRTMAYPPHAGPAIGPTPKRRGAHAPAGHQGQMMGAPYNAEAAFDDEEDVSRGDMFDHLSPREISMARYQQNHEWMEEILSSPYRIGQIEASDLGLGRKGELASLTEGIFEAQGADALVAGPKKPYTGRLDPALADEFRKRVTQRNAATRAEIEQMKAQHAKLLAKFKGNAAIKHAERDLRAATEGTGTEFWRLEGRLDGAEEDGSHSDQKQPSQSLEEIVARVEELVGKRAVAVSDVHRVQDGGYQEPAPEPELLQPQHQVPGGVSLSGSMSRQPSHAGSGVMLGDSDIDMGGTAAGLLDMHTGFSSTSTPFNSFPTPQPQLSAIPSNAATPANLHGASPAPAPTTQPPAPAQADVHMADASAHNETTTAPDQGTGSGDWVVVPKADAGPPPAPANPAASTAATTTTTTTTHKPASAAATPADADANDFSSLGDLDTAGDALAGYDPPSGDDELNLDLEDSAFGDAFHGVQQAGASGEGDTPAGEGL
ncbi:uncharacterized protein THITE_119311 [Thermothielavioides terrestris NRRL 8126]|uniref:DUF1750-domain-containing protein n=1 Tax=Thermothielavioides terrestris (strain ATCC 38088 / NRRL 8126) TaxID=578455 RepID=G2R2Z0_THETT|nr:uncharacterized protein THITE_119311 [Thermothielavioides terrestris NRRL 8126]AEO65906.1 hypothetical protein THITE_119311 [Thermothielavioides terrestris NRRL 8126]